MSLELISFNWSECCYREINLVAGIELIERQTWRQGDVRRLCTVLFLSPFQNRKVCEIGNTSCNSSRVLCTQQLRKYLCILSCWYLFIHSSLDFYDYTFQDFFLPPYILHQFSCLCWLFLHCLTSEYWSTHGFILGLFLFPLITFPLSNLSVLWLKKKNTIFMTMISKFLSLSLSLTHLAPHASYRYISNCLLKFPLGYLIGISNLTCPE